MDARERRTLSVSRKKGKGEKGEEETSDFSISEQMYFPFSHLTFSCTLLLTAKSLCPRMNIS
jgi:hypothetical protein